ncbi:MAG: ABC transporter permease [Chloroflexi bacterium]|nr:MAG: ABC transporter permease [Chloroflexota bacterium]RLC85338.1 MAG: ABC transporter permease [Chloroflexota bacterium]
MIGILLLMWALNGSQFLRLGNFQSMAFQLPELGILSLAMMVTMLTAGINLSIIASANLTGIVTALILTRFVTPETTGAASFAIVILAVGAGLLTSAAIGLLNGFLIANVEVSPILATLGTMTLLNGVAIVMTKGYVISGFPEAIRFIGNGQILGIPVPMIVFIACAALMALLLTRTRMGVSVYMLGSNPTACHFSGINNASVLLKTYLVSGLYSGIAAIIMMSRFNSAKADYGESYLLMTVLASVLGGTSAAGGFGKVSGLVIALVILQIISSGLNLLRVSNFLTIAIWGGILILVMVINYVSEQYQKRRTA